VFGNDPRRKASYPSVRALAANPEVGPGQIDNPCPIYEDTERGRKENRKFWQAIVWEVQIWLGFAVLCVVTSILLLVLLLLDALAE
jgi:hypothetical protein